jgi:hypothetical protein
MPRFNIYTGEWEYEAGEKPPEEKKPEEKPIRLELTKEDIEKFKGYIEKAKELWEKFKEAETRARLRKALKEAGIEIIKPEEVKAKPEEEEFARVLREAGIEVI